MNVTNHWIFWRNQMGNIKIFTLTPSDLDAVDRLMKRNSRTLGFLPRNALKEFLNKGGVLGAKSQDGQLVAYLLYAAYSKYFRITQLCAHEEHRGKGIARRLLNELIASANTQKVIKLNCRRNFPVDKLWPKLGFVAQGEKPGRSKAGHLLTLWHLVLAPEEQLELFQARVSDEMLDVIIDANIFFDFDKPDSNQTTASKALLSDFLIDSLNLWITEEIFNEINRHSDPIQRENSRTRAHGFPKIETVPHLYEHFVDHLEQVLPHTSPSEESDIRHLAKAASSHVRIFITRDQGLLNKAEKISDITGLEIISPLDLIIRLHELSERESYAPERIAGHYLRWQRLASNDLISFPYESFLQHQETKGKFREKLEPFIAQPNQFKCELLRSGETIIAIRILAISSKKVLTITLARVASSVNGTLFKRFLIADTVSEAVKRNLNMAKFEIYGLTPSLFPDLLEMGFNKCSGCFVRFCFTQLLSRKEVLSEISVLSPESEAKYKKMPDLELERCCAPLALKAMAQKYFLLPIRPFYAMNLIDRDRSANDLFGGNRNVLLRWNNVYYKTKTHHKMLRAPGRILWYVSQTRKQVIAVSCLDDVLVDTAKALFQNFKKFGILEWKDLYEMCDGDLSRNLMALKFSNTFLFREPIPLNTLRDVFSKDGTGLSVQSPSTIPTKTFQKLYRIGYPNKS